LVVKDNFKDGGIYQMLDKDIAWKIFEQTGNVDAYCMYRNAAIEASSEIGLDKEGIEWHEGASRHPQNDGWGGVTG